IALGAGGGRLARVRGGGLPRAFDSHVSADRASVPRAQAPARRVGDPRARAADERAPRVQRARSGHRVRAEEHEVVAVDHLVAALVAEEALDLARVRAFDLVELDRGVVDEPARELPAVGRDAAHAVADAEAALDRADAGREEA